MDDLVILPPHALLVLEERVKDHQREGLLCVRRDGVPGLVWASGGRPRVVFGFTITDGRIVEIDMVADPERTGRLDLSILES